MWYGAGRTASSIAIVWLNCFLRVLVVTPVYEPVADRCEAVKATTRSCVSPPVSLQQPKPMRQILPSLIMASYSLHVRLLDASRALRPLYSRLRKLLENDGISSSREALKLCW